MIATPMITSQFDSLLGTSYIPDDDEILQVRSLITEKGRELEKIDAEMSRIMASYVKLKKTRERMRADIEPYRRFIAISRRLPDYILQQIFLSCLPEQYGAIMSVREPPLIFTLVCRRWRQLALSTPSLWASFYVPVPLPSYSFGDEEEQIPEDPALTVTVARVKAIQDWGQRAQQCPLAITLRNELSYNSDGQVYYDLLLSAILSLSKCWKHLAIFATVPQIQRVVGLSQSQAPNLESLTVAANTPREDENMQTPFDNPELFKSTALRRLTFRALYGNIRIMPISWSTLTHISVSEGYACKTHSVDDIAYILTACKRLISFSFDMGVIHQYDELHTSSPRDMPAISLPHLKHIHLRTGHHVTGDAPAAGLPLDVPAIQEVSYYFAQSLTRPSALHFWLETSYGRLQTLETSHTLFQQDDFLACLYLCPNLETLKIDVSSGPMTAPLPVWAFSDEFFRRFTTFDDSRRILCPKMKKLQFVTERRFNELTDGGILELIRGKQDGNVSGLSKLEILDMFLPRRQSIPLGVHVNPYVDDGLDLRLAFEHEADNTGLRPSFNRPPEPFRWDVRQEARRYYDSLT
ncbi:hypothetical protein NLJ89_g8777 [Agrocybe chaxingu]|uniref:F-box domain-containing protein n=1 Tax=Agrocybe chaxingu TaxID=84603 RepID=A0A9W8JTS2_9AGAR|nr:hypothetical protein NLJ89_g8777 [Agrocybe chaxingu]